MLKLQHVVERARWLFFKADLGTLRFFLASSSLVWAVLLLLPGYTFERPTYEIMATMAVEVVWAAAFLIHAILTFLDLAGYHARLGKLVRLGGSLIGCAVWTTASIAMFVSVYPAAAGIAPNLVGGAAAWWLLVRCRD